MPIKPDLQVIVSLFSTSRGMQFANPGPLHDRAARRQPGDRMKNSLAPASRRATGAARKDAPPVQSRLRRSVCALLLSLASASASALPYAYANIAFSELSLQGLGAPGVIISGATVTTSSSANYPVAPPDGASASGSLVGGSDVRQALAGDDLDIPENFFGQALQAARGARGDASVTGNLLAGVPSGTGNVVAEGNLGPIGSASSSAGTSTGFTINLTLTSPASFTLGFVATDLLIATTTDDNEGASAQVNASFTVTGQDGFFAIFAPVELNASTSSAAGAGDGFFASAPTRYRYDIALNAGVYQFSLLAGAQQRVEASEFDPVPEPAPLALIGIGMLGMFGMRMGRRPAQAL
jgi:hypothetical protein